MSKEDCLKEITIIGAGLTGSLLGILLGRLGYSVQIYERNKDPKHTFVKLGKSINLTLCKRGVNALEKAGLGDEVQKLWVPVYGRCLHLIFCCAIVIIFSANSTAVIMSCGLFNANNIGI